MLTAVTTGLIVVLGLFFLYWWAKRAFIRSLQAYFESPNEETPAEFDNIVMKISAIVGQQTAFHLKQAMLGTSSGQARGEKAVERAIKMDQIAARNPTLAAILGAPALKKLTGGKPWLSDIAVEYIANKGGDSNLPGNGGARSNPVKFGGF